MSDAPTYVCPQCRTGYFEEQECDWCPGVRVVDFDPAGKIDWFNAAIAASALIFIFSIVGHIDFVAAEAAHNAAKQRSALATELARAYDLCPPQAEGDTPIVTLVVRMTADDKPEVIGCTRIVHRAYQIRQKSNSFKKVTAQ